MTKKFTGVIVIVIAVIAVAGVVCLYTRSFSSSKHEEPKQKAPADMLPPEQPAPSIASKSFALEVPPHTAHDKSSTPEMKIMQTKSIDELIADAKAAINRKAYDKAVPLLKQALENVQDVGQRRMIMVMLAEALLCTQDYVGAEALYKDLLAGAVSDDERVLASIQLAQLYTVQKNYTAAERVLEEGKLMGANEALRTQIQHAQLRVWQSQPGRLGEVASNLEVRVAFDPNDRASLELLGTIYLRVQRDYAKAKPVYEKMLANDPTNSALQNTMINICQETRDYDQARGIYERYLESHPAEADGIRFQIAALYLQSGKGDDAVAYAEQHLGGTNGTSDQLQLVARIYEHAGRLDDSLCMIQQAETRTQAADKRVDLRFQQEDLLARQQKYADAEKVVRQIMADFGSDPAVKARANNELIRLYQVQGKMSELHL